MAHASPTHAEAALDRKGNLVLSQARFLVGKKAPFFRPLLVVIVQRQVTDCATAYMTKTGVLGYNVEFFAGLTHQVAAGVVAHELLHLWLKHHERLGPRDPQRWNVACDRALYGMLVQMGFELPSFHLKGADIGLSEGLTADEYYRQADKRSDKGLPQRTGQGPGTGSPCGSATGNPHPGEPASSTPGAHQGGRTEAQLNRARHQANEAVRSARQQGTVPGALVALVEKLSTPAKIPWRQELATALRTACGYRAGAVVHRYDAPGRRQAGLGFGAGRPVMPRLRQPIPRVAVAVDTSGSMMGADELSTALTEADGVLKAVGAEVEFVSCDAAVQSLGKARTVREMAAMLKGGGGTDFCPVFVALAARRPPPEVVVFCTDGIGPAPDRPPPGMVVIWLLIGEGSQPPCTWGRVIRVDDADKDI